MQFCQMTGVTEICKIKSMKMKNDEHIKNKTNLVIPILLNMHEAAESLDVCYRTMQELVYKRQIGFVQIGKNYKFRPRDLNEFVEKNYIKPVK
jgi:excisionase family DNA binding protein